MKTNKHGGKNGGALIAVLLTIFVVAVAITSYLSMVTNQNNTVARSQAWGEAIPVAESGVEEALTQIHYCWIDNLTTNSWTLGTDGYYHKNRTNSDGSYYSVCIVPTNPPTIFSTGYVRVPYYTSTNTYVARHIKVLTRPPSSGGISAKGSITMSGNGYVDSFDSSSSQYSSNGQYVASMATADATVTTDSSASGAIQASKIYGYVTTGPTGSESGGSVGDMSWVNGGTNGVEPGHSANNANVQFDDVAAPFSYGSGLSPTANGTYLGTNYAYILPTGGDYNMPLLSMASSSVMLVLGNPCILYVNGPVTIAGQADIYIAPSACLYLYENGDGSFAGNGIINASGYATNCYVYGMTNCTTMKFAGNNAYSAVVYAPDSAFTYAGNADFTGALTASTVSITGNGNFHYDQSIGAKGGVVKSWNEF